MKVLILEDDPAASDFIAKMIWDYFPDYIITGQVISVKDASKNFNLERPDLLIMDINLGDHSSFELFDYIDPSQLTVIFTTSYQEFALKAIKVDAVDYLIKPINIEDFKSAIQKAEERIKLRQGLMGKNAEPVERTYPGRQLLIFEKDRLKPIPIHAIIKIRASGAYSVFTLDNGKVIRSSKNLGNYERMLADEGFIRIHDSCVVNIAHLLSYKPGLKANVLLSDNSTEMVSKGRKRDFLKFYKD